MIKRTLYFGNPAYLSLSKEQLVIKLPEVERSPDLPESFKQDAVRTIPIEDIGVILLDHSQITLTHALMARLMEENVALISCDQRHHPIGLFMPLESNVLQSERFSAQINASEPLKKQLWQQTIRSKIENQSVLLKGVRPSFNIANMNRWVKEVTSGDILNHEARAAAYYWANLFEIFPNFVRGRQEEYPNPLLNYGYTILRALVARALVGSGLLPTLGIHHHSRYNAYCLADDIMEPYRPYSRCLSCSNDHKRFTYTRTNQRTKSEFPTTSCHRRDNRQQTESFTSSRFSNNSLLSQVLFRRNPKNYFSTNVIMQRFSEYRIMWVMIFFDLPTETAKERKAASDFRKKIMTDGFTMFQFSIYMRHCPSSENAEVHIKRVKRLLPEFGNIGILTITDKQFSNMELFVGTKERKKQSMPQQLELF